MSDLEKERQAIIEQLSSAYAVDALELDELERRVEQAEQADSVEALVPLVADLSPASASASGSTALVPTADAPDRRSLVTVFGSVSRDRSWTVPRRLKVISVFGGTDLDFRKARLGPGTTEVKVISVMAGVRVVVPPGLPVEVEGVGILGAFDEHRVEGEGQEGSPCRLRITGAAILSGVEVEDRLPGETGKQARRRRKQARRALKDAATDRLIEARRDRDADTD